MTWPKLLIRDEATSIAAATERPAVSLRGASKIYRLYSSPHEQLLDQSGLYKLMFWRSPPSFREFYALRDVNLTIARGERVGIIGRNGAGKTTLLKLVTGNFVPTSGSIEVHGTVQALMQLGIGFHPEFSGYENIRAALNYNGLTGNELNEALEDVIDFVELGEFLHQPLKTYSLGMNARLQFAAATAIKPDILIIDEILGAGDAYFAAKSAMRMEKLAMSGCTVLLVSHSWQQIQQYCQRAVWLREGRVFMDGPASNVLAAYDVYIAEETAKPAHAAASVSDAAPKKLAGPAAIANVGASFSAPAGEKPVEPDRLEGPDYAEVPWIAKQIKEKDAVNEAEELCDYLDDGHRAFRIRGKPGLRFCYIGVKSRGERVNVARTGDDFTIEFGVIADRSDNFTCSYWIHFFGIDGRRLCRVESQVDRFFLRQGGKRFVRLDMTPLLLGAGDYLLSFSMFDQSKTNSTVDLAATRFEMLARSYQLRVSAANDSDPPVVHYPARWQFGDDKELVPSALKSAV
jgi:homopolymeric O-antigen transport system ATP-binding protein